MENLIEITDSSFDKQRIRFCRLLVQVGIQDFSYCIIDKRYNKLVYLKAVSGLENENDFATLVAEDEFLKLEFDSRIISTESNQSTLIPDAFYDAQKKEELLGFNFPALNEIVLSDKLKNPNAYNVFAISSRQYNFIESAFAHEGIHHSTTVLIESTMLRFRYKTRPIMVINVRKEYFDVVVINNNELQFYNSFFYQSGEDFIYYILYVCEQLQFNHENLETYFSGMVDEHSNLNIIINKYMRNVNFLPRTLNHSFGDEFDHFLSHQFATLLDLNLCES